MRKLAIVTFFAAVTFAATQLNFGIAHADIGPTPINSQGGTVRPASNTNVVMQDEKVVLTYAAPKGTGEDKTMDVHVTATFTMKNDAAPETMNVYFPSSDSTFVEGFEGKDITNFAVNGKEVTNTTNVAAGFGGSGSTIKAFWWSQNFPTGTTTINVSYDSQSNIRFGLFNLTYVLGTGRNWSGTIKNGEVDFVLPIKNIPQYAVTATPPILKASDLPYTLSGNTIKVNFSDYEPAADAAIALGVGDPDVINTVQQDIAAKPKTVDAYLSIANLFRSLSGGPHCVVCTKPAAAQADYYYTLALDAATNETELNKVFATYAWGDGTKNLTPLIDLFTYFARHQTCADSDSTCWENEMALTEVPFTFDTKTKLASYSDFLAKYACRERAYNTQMASIVEVYAGKTVSSCPVTTPSATTEPSQTKTTTAPSIPWLLIGLVSGGVVVLAAGIVTTVLIIRHRRKMVAPQGKQVAAPDNKNKTEPTNADSESETKPVPGKVKKT